MNTLAKSSHEKSACKEEFIQHVLPIFCNPRKRDVSAPAGLILYMAFAREFTEEEGGALAEAVVFGAPHTLQVLALASFINVQLLQAQLAEAGEGGGRAGERAEGGGAEGFSLPHARHTRAPSRFTSVHLGQVQGILLIYRKI